MAQQKQDRRSQRTQQALLDALVALLAVKHYDEISVNDIIMRANVGRSTFYAHYQTKDDLMKRGFERALDMFIQQIPTGNIEQDMQLDTTPLFRHAQGHYELFRTLAWGSGFEILTRDGHATLSAKFEERFTKMLTNKPEPALSIAVLSYSLAGSLLILLKWWLEHKMPYSPEDMDGIFQQLMMPGVRNILGSTGISNSVP